MFVRRYNVYEIWILCDVNFLHGDASKIAHFSLFCVHVQVYGRFIHRRFIHRLHPYHTLHFDA